MRHVAAIAILALISCSGDKSVHDPNSPTDDNHPSTETFSIEVSPSTVSLEEGDTRQLLATVRDANGTALSNPSVQWQSNNSSVVTVTANGLVTAKLHGGPVSVVASSNGVSANAKVTVTTHVAPVSPLASGTIYAGVNNLAAFQGGPVTREIVSFVPSTGAMINLTQNPAADDFPRASPDGEYLLFNSSRFAGIVGIMRRDGTNPTSFQLACGSLTNECIYSAAWLPDGRIIFYYNDLSFAGQVSAVGIRSATSTVTQYSNVPISFPRSVSFSPIGDFAAFQSGGALLTMRLSTNQITTVATACTFASTCTFEPQWSPSGQFLYALRQSVVSEFAIGSGSPRQLYTATSGDGIAEFALSPDGSQMAVIDGGSVKVISISSPNTVTTVYATGSISSLHAYGFLAWSPDGQSIAFVLEDNLPHLIYAVNTNGTGLKQIGEVGFAHGLKWGK